LQALRQLTPNTDSVGSLDRVVYMPHSSTFHWHVTGMHSFQNICNVSSTLASNMQQHHATSHVYFDFLHHPSYASLSLFLLVQTCCLSKCVSARFTRASAAVTSSELSSTASEGSSRFRVKILPHEPRPLGCLASLLGA
jgi:hypothetical protein